jgi:hypothetical protein
MDIKMAVDDFEKELEVISNNVIEARNACNEALKAIEQTKRFINKLAIKQSEEK